MLSFLFVLNVYLNCVLFVYMNCVLCMLSFLFDLLCFDYCVLVVFLLRCRARVAPPVVEAEDELSFQDKFLPPEPPVRQRGRGRRRG